MDVKQHQPNTYSAGYYVKGKVSTELRGCVKVEVAILASPSLIALMLSVDVNTMKERIDCSELRNSESRGGSPVPNSSYVYVDVKRHKRKNRRLRAQELCESRGGRPGFPVPNSPYGFRGAKAP